MNTQIDFAPGSLVSLYDRPWIVLPPQNNPKLLRLKPLEGKEEEIIGLYLPLFAPKIHLLQKYKFPPPKPQDLGDWNAAQLLYNAARLSFRDVAGPFRALGRIAFEPRAYQLTPLIMALKQETPTRLLIADDVGVGKTIEAMLIAYELYLRKEIDRFAVICPPHLCPQWQNEIQSKLGLEAPILRSGTAAALERKTIGFQNIFHAFPSLVISIDYIKMPDRKQFFLDNAPPLVIIDEAHAAAKPAEQNATEKLQQRYALLQKLAQNPEQRLLLLTATPHSGKEEEFQSLLGLLKPEWQNLSLTDAQSQEQKKELARYFLQRRRADVLKLESSDSQIRFPQRKSFDLDYDIGPHYGKLFDQVLQFTRSAILESPQASRKKIYCYWEAIALLRSLMSSPQAAALALQNKAQAQTSSAPPEEITLPEPDLWDKEDAPLDDNLISAPTQELGANAQQLLQFAQKAQEIAADLKKDNKALKALQQIQKWLNQGKNPVVFCLYIQTARYLGCQFEKQLAKKYPRLQIQTVTGEMDDELRKQIIESLNQAEQRLLIATDCLSEGINLQEGFDALLHYDLPWNPNRLEQREGRIDRFGQRAPTVEVAILYGNNNPIDGILLEVLLRKAREIRQSIGITVPFPENSASIMQVLASALLLRPQISIRQVHKQLTLIDTPEIEIEKNKVAKAFEKAEKNEKISRNIFAQSAIKIEEVKKYLQAAQKAIGAPADVEKFVLDAFRYWGCSITPQKEPRAYAIDPLNAPSFLNAFFPKNQSFFITFETPPPQGYNYIGRNHPIIEAIALYLLCQNDSLKANSHPSAARAAVIKTSIVKQKTTLLLLRLRAILAQKQKHTPTQWLTEEVALWGYQTQPNIKENILTPEQAQELFFVAKPEQNIEKTEAQYWIQEELETLSEEAIEQQLIAFAQTRAQQIAEQQNELRKILQNKPYFPEQIATPEILGLYLLLPLISS
jgi:superfamily II DNA or RNA helicase